MFNPFPQGLSIEDPARGIARGDGRTGSLYRPALSAGQHFGSQGPLSRDPALTAMIFNFECSSR